MLDNNFFFFRNIWFHKLFSINILQNVAIFFKKKMMDNNFVSTFSMAPRRRKARRPVARRVGLARAPGGSPWRARWPGDGGMQQLSLRLGFHSSPDSGRNR
jgi:hypothetical protein